MCPSDVAVFRSAGLGGQNWGYFTRTSCLIQVTVSEVIQRSGVIVSKCGSCGAEAGEKCRMGDCCPNVTCCCMSAGTVRSSTWHALLHVQDEFLRVSWDRVPCWLQWFFCVPADMCSDILGLAPLLCGLTVCLFN